MENVNHVFFLCAAWCSTCRDIQTDLDAFKIPGYQLHWVDIEDRSDALEDVDVLTFPTILVADRQGGVLFAGPIEPRMANLERLLETLPRRGASTRIDDSWRAAACNLINSLVKPA